jgi:predicted nucleic acid-binding protein
MDGVVDSNVIFAALISGNEKYIDIFQKCFFHVPDFALLELQKYEERIIRKSKLKEGLFRLFVKQIFEEIIVIPKFAISQDSYSRAFELCENVDENDTPFLALCIEYNYPLWTNDKVLSDGLKLKGFNNFINMDKLLTLFR